MNVTVKTIKHENQRYETVGDWQNKKNGDLDITVSDLGDWKMNFLIAFHEQIEAVLCRDRCISQEDVDNFDKEYEARRPEGDTSEPGDSPLAPYNREHVFATKLEKKLARELNVDWRKYEETINSL